MLTLGGRLSPLRLFGKISGEVQHLTATAAGFPPQSAPLQPPLPTPVVKHRQQVPRVRSDAASGQFRTSLLRRHQVACSGGHFLSIRHKITTLPHSTHIAVCVWFKIQRLYLLHGGEMLVWQNLTLFCMQGIEKV